MKVRFENTELPGLVVVRHEVFQDDRGFFQEVYRRDLFEEMGLPTEFVQLNHSRSAAGVLRGLHFQWQPAMGKMMRVTAGRAFLVAVDVRYDSPTLGRWFGIEMKAGDGQQLLGGAGFARGFASLEDGTEIQYLCTGTYDSSGEGGIRWNDSEIGIEWPLKEPQLSAKDTAAPTLNEWLDGPHGRAFSVETS